jgi:GAF domain-containing protein
MKDALAAEAVAQGDNDEIRAILADVCRVTGMGFAAVARVTEERWIACQVLDKIEFGLEPGQELEIKTTICDEIRQCGQTIIIDHVAENFEWRTHPTPMLYGFESYASLPILLSDGVFYGTLCAIDPAPHELSGPAIVAMLEAHATRLAAILQNSAATVA